MAKWQHVLWVSKETTNFQYEKCSLQQSFFLVCFELSPALCKNHTNIVSLPESSEVVASWIADSFDLSV